MPHRFIARRLRNWFIYRVLHVNDTPRRIALGVAIGVFICWTPSMPFQMILTVALSWLLGANKFVGLPFVWISNPLTIIPVYGPSYVLGSWIIRSDYKGLQALVKASRFSGNLFEVAQAWWNAIWAIFWELWVGSLIVGLVLGVLTYFAMYRIIIVYRQYRHRHHEGRETHPAPANPGTGSLPAGPEGGSKPRR